MAIEPFSRRNPAFALTTATTLGLATALLVEPFQSTAGSRPTPPPPHLVKDICDSPTIGSFPSDIVALGSRAFFFATAEGDETTDNLRLWGLWKSDGSASGTALVKALRNPSSSAAPVNLGDRIAFVACGVESSCGLWTVDNSNESPVLVFDITSRDYSWPAHVTALGTRVLFQVSRPNKTAELWISDPQHQQNRQLMEIGPNPFQPLGVSSEHATAYLAFGDETTGTELWRTDGTAGGTSLLKDIAPGPYSSNPSPGVALGARFYFAASDPFHGRQLWVTDGTSDGTLRVTDTGPDGSVFSVFAGSEGLSALVQTAATPSYALWVTDGTPQGSRRVELPQGYSLHPHPPPVAVGRNLFFVAMDRGGHWTLWVCEAGTGTVAQLPGLADTYPQPLISGLTAFRNGVQFVVRRESSSELWQSDGTAPGTRRISTFGYSNWDAYGFAETGGKLFFSAYHPVLGRELWVSDGTPDGTWPVADLNPSTPASLPNRVTSLDKAVVFQAFDSEHGSSVWSSDGTTAGTKRFSTDPIESDLPAGKGMGIILRAGDRVYLKGSPEPHAEAIWAADPATGLSRELFRFSCPGLGDTVPSLFNHAQDVLALVVDCSGTPYLAKLLPETGAVETLRTFPGYLSWGLYGGGTLASGNTLFYLKNEEQVDEHWATDGTPAGTSMVAPSFLWGTLHNGILFYTCGDFAQAAICRTDGTPQGSWLVSYVGQQWRLGELRSNGRFVLFWADDGVHGIEPWVTDGTSEGTHLLKDLVPGPAGSIEPGVTSGPIPFGDSFVFTGKAQHTENRLWITDGTESGTRILANLSPPTVPDRAWAGAEHDGLLYLAVDHGWGLDVITPGELWGTDGTAENTRMFTGLETPTLGWSPQFTLAGGRLFFVARDALHSFELFAIDKAARRARRHLAAAGGS